MTRTSWIGKTLSSRYVIDELLGQGGMSAVYKGTDPNLKRVVAIKMIHTHLSDNADFVQRFEEEAAAVAQLRHNGIIQVHDFNQDNGVYYMVLEFVPGETIQEFLKRLNDDKRHISSVKAAAYMADICDAVDYAHQRGMIHRDIKPANIMLTVNDQVILMDFGIAKIVGGTRHTATGAVVGTAMYMSPEQIKGEQPDRRTDIYSLGVTLFEMVSGKPPFDADSSMSLMMKHINDPVPNPRTLNPDVPDELIAVINKAMAKDPNQRYQTAAQMAIALRDVMSRIKSGTAAYTPIQSGATVMESSPAIQQQQTAYEAPPPAKGTVVESGPMTGMGSNQGTSVESSGVRLPKQQFAQPEQKPKSRLPLIIGGVVVLICLVGGALALAGSLFSGGGSEPTQAPVVVATEPPVETEVAVVATEPPTATEVPASPTPSTPYVVITSITLEGNQYSVNYEVANYTSSSMHVHMFFNNVPPDQAGSPGNGPWKLTYGSYGPSPFTQYGPANKPADATQMCALVANGNHSVIPNSGNCVDLP